MTKDEIEKFCAAVERLRFGDGSNHMEDAAAFEKMMLLFGAFTAIFGACLLLSFALWAITKLGGS